MLSRLAASIPPERWRAIGLSGMIPTIVTLDDAGLPTGPALTWEDCRAHDGGRRDRLAVRQA